MDKIDEKIIKRLARDCKISSGVVQSLALRESTEALVRVRNPLHLGYVERNFDVVALYPFIRSVAIKCGLKDAVMLERMQEVEYVSAQSKVFALGENDDVAYGGQQNAGGGRIKPTLQCENDGIRAQSEAQSAKNANNTKTKSNEVSQYGMFSPHTHFRRRA